jgi:hypothetical protein
LCKDRRENTGDRRQKKRNGIVEGWKSGGRKKTGFWNLGIANLGIEPPNSPFPNS